MFKDTNGCDDDGDGDGDGVATVIGRRRRRRSKEGPGSSVAADGLAGDELKSCSTSWNISRLSSFVDGFFKRMRWWRRRDLFTLTKKNSKT